MKPLLPGCISENQSAFLKGRLISDNILVAHELLHYICSSKNGPNKGAALKLDMEKAFDRVEWTFLRSVLLHMGFHSDWVDLLMDCVSTVSFRIRINGRLSPVIFPQRGLRQGDPLSPFLFVICMQGLSATLLAEQAAGRIMGIRTSQKGPQVNHLLYADDSIVFIRNSEREASRLKEVLRLFAESSGQRINFGKSTVFYSPSTPSADRHRISAILGIAEVFDPGIYLGVPLRVGKNKTNIFGFLNEKVDDRVSGWTKRLLSFGGREIFLKSVAEALPLYIMSCYLLPHTITDRITSSMRRYWWSGKLSERGWPLLAWDKICTPKNAGGLGLRDLRRFNIALLGKQLWRFLVFPDSLVARVFRAKYYRSGILLDAGLPDHASYAWKGLHSALQEFRGGFLPLADSQGGGSAQASRVLDTFRDCLDRNHLIDCKPISGWFTWLYTNSVSGSVIQERLDRYLATREWFTLFPDYRVSSFFTAKSDHCFLLMETSHAVSVKGGTRDYFRFDNCWSKEEGCIEKVRSSWLHSSGSTVSRLQAIGDSLRSWQADRRVSSTKRMSDLQGFLNSCMQGTIIDEAKTAFLEAKREHKSLLDKDEAYWAQRARVTWLTHGDRNTAYFHARATGRRKKNRIRGLFDESGIWTDKQAEVAGVAMRYFSTLFSSSQPTPNSSLLSNIAPCISFDDNSYLLRPFTDVEILAAFQDINPTKAPGIDSLPGSFFRQHWELIGPDILRLCHDLLSRKIDMSCVNATVITLIPKVEDSVRMQQLRPISLCTVVYKIVSKTILNRMKPLLPGCISENQSAFLKGRLISDNILVAHELLHYICSSKNGPNKGAALKLDMEKAFDRVEWTFLRSVLLRLGFHSDWVDLLMGCVSTVSFRIRINGRLSPVLIPQRGLRQGDPLSPFLFVICMQGLSATLLAEQAAGRIMGIRASQKGPRVNHLLYADDSVVFIRNSEREASRLKEVLRLFADSSGQRINFGKSTVFFSPSTPSADRHRISDILGIVEVFNPGIYLGVPLRVGKNKTNVFGFLNEKVDDRVSGWTKRLLSFGGREIFLKSVAQALPLYIMPCYLLPRTITDRITSSMRRYWWSGKLSERGWPLLAWDKICTPKNAGGLGLRDLRRFNLALLGKQLWRFLVFPDSLVARVFRAKYYHSGSLLDAGLPDHASYSWKGLHSAL
ncbi:hypothetical protein GQ457_08G033300 [Hibiscus cannabinus]